MSWLSSWLDPGGVSVQVKEVRFTRGAARLNNVGVAIASRTQRFMSNWSSPMPADPVSHRSKVQWPDTELKLHGAHVLTEPIKISVMNKRRRLRTVVGVAQFTLVSLSPPKSGSEPFDLTLSLETTLSPKLNAKIELHICLINADWTKLAVPEHLPGEETGVLLSIREGADSDYDGVNAQDALDALANDANAGLSPEVSPSSMPPDHNLNSLPPSTAPSIGSTVRNSQSSTHTARSLSNTRGFGFNLDSDTLGVLFLEIVSVTNLPKFRTLTGISFDMDPFVVIGFGKRVCKTPYRRHTLNPTFNCKIAFDVGQRESGYAITFTVWDKDRITLNDHVAETELSVARIIRDFGPQLDPVTGLYDLRHHVPASIHLPLLHKAGCAEMLVKAHYYPVAAIRQQLWRGIISLYEDVPVAPKAKKSRKILRRPRPLKILGSIHRKTHNSLVHHRNHHENGGSVNSNGTAAVITAAAAVSVSAPAQGKAAAAVSVDRSPAVSTAASTASGPPDQTDTEFEDGEHIYGDELTDAEEYIDGHAGVEGHTGANNRLDVKGYTDASIEAMAELAIDDVALHEALEEPAIDNDESSMGLSFEQLKALLNSLGSTFGDEDIKQSFFRDHDRDPNTDRLNDDLIVFELEHLVNRQSGHERVILFRICPICRQTSTKDKGAFKHMSLCASRHWAESNSELLGDSYVTSAHASKRWYSNFLSKFSYGSYKLGAHSANILVQDRVSGQISEEKIASSVRIGIRMIYSLGPVEKKRFQGLLKKYTLRQGIKYSKPSSVSQIEPFIKFHNIDMSDVLLPVSEFKTFNEFFFRKLKPDARPCENPDDPRTAVSAADCRLTVFPSVNKATELWIKGKNFSIAHLLGNTYPEDVDRYTKGNSSLAIFRLAPQDYHRVHCPVEGTMGKVRHIEGHYYTVNPMAIRSSLDVFGENARSVFPIDSPQFGRVMVVMVGAMMVGSCVVTAKEGQYLRRTYELGYFQFGGSTVVVLFEIDRMVPDGDLLLNSSLKIETLVKVGMSLGHTPDIPEFIRTYDTCYATINRAKSLISGAGAYMPFALD